MSASIKNIKPLFELLAEIGNVTEDVITAVKKGAKWKAVAEVGQLLDELLALQGITWSELDDDWKASRAEHHATLREALKQKLDFEDDKAEEKIELAIDLLGRADRFITDVIDLGKSFAKK